MLILVSCSGSNTGISDKLIKEISTIKETNDGVVSIVPENATNLLYLKLDNNKMASISALELQDIYKHYYKNIYPTFYDFLKKALNQEICLKVSQIQGYELIIFDLEDKIMKTSIDRLEERYFKKINRETYCFLPKDIALNLKQTILYKMFINGYMINFDDYAGTYIIKKYENT
ncbi:MAG: hypothetical protein EAS48_04380 [Chryseobacterium sp.]|nr:MAG: hypothetical protein EAS48_04380 [Chryseobacterium sp.]